MVKLNRIGYLFILFLIIVKAKVPGNETRYFRIGDLQSHFTAYGSERAWNNEYYEGMRWPALYQYTDNFVIKRAWVGVQDFTDENGHFWDYWSNYNCNCNNIYYKANSKRVS